MDFEKRRSLMKAFVISQFNDCPSICMFHNRALNNRINKIHERALRALRLEYQNKSPFFSDLLELNNLVTTYQRNLQTLVKEIFQVKTNLSPEIMKQVLDFQEPYYNRRHKFFFNFYQELPTCTKILQSCLVGWCMYCVTLRLHDIKKLTSVSLEYTMEMHLAYAYILPFW